MATCIFIGVLLSLTVGSFRAGKWTMAPSPVRAEVTEKVAQPLRVVAAPISTYRPVKSRKIDTIVIHYMSGINVDRNRWADPQLCRTILRQNRVSAHYLIDRAGVAYRLVDEHNVAWHAGGSMMPTPDNRKNVNAFSIGIELIATNKSGFTDAQYTVLASLIQDINTRYAIRHLVGHDDIAGLRVVRTGLRKDVKEDPGPLFDWERLRMLLRTE